MNSVPVGLLLGLVFVGSLCLRLPPIPLPEPKGNPQPERNLQRYRRNLYPKDDNYYQWWYYWIKDEDRNFHATVTYAVSLCGTGKHCDMNGTYMGISFVDGKTNRTFQKVLKYEETAFEDVEEHSFHVKINGNKDEFQIFPEDDNHFTLTGAMVEDKNVWVCHNCEQYYPDQGKDVNIAWDLKISRKYGWYAQKIFEIPDEWLKGVIMWNTYSYYSTVSGSLTIGNEKYEFDGRKTHIAYGDQNFGQILPASPPKGKGRGSKNEEDYSWGWYVCHQDDFSFAAGVGKTYADKFLGTMIGGFADIRINSSYELSVRDVYVFESSEDPGQHFYSSTDSLLHPATFTVTRTNWVNHTDEFGIAEFPLSQVLLIESECIKLTARFSSTEDNYNRLLFPLENTIFSDFEGLGVTAEVEVIDKTNGKKFEFTNERCGVEYGHQYEVVIPKI